MKSLRSYLETPLHIAPLATFRVLFGGIMLISVLRFMLKGWIYELYVAPEYFFSYYGFEWVQPLSESGMYVVFGLMALAALLMALGLFYRVAAPTFFLLFTYTELLDKTNYLNHYYFVSIVAFLMIWVPAHRYFSLDVMRKPKLKRTQVPRWIIGIFRLQLGVVYVFAGMAKLNADWMLRAQPMRIWLPAQAHLPLVGGLLKLKAVAFLFSWAGALYDLTIPFFLLMRRTRRFAYLAVIGFHLMTWFMFPIGMFPWIMMLSSLIFLPAEKHRQVLEWIQTKFSPREQDNEKPLVWSMPGKNLLLAAMGLHFLLQVLLPFRHHLYEGDLFWHEQGYRFSWRVMLMEKAGYAIFHVRDPRTGGETEITNGDYLTPNQEKMMATQPDMILQFARHLDAEFRHQGIPDPEIYAEVYVTLNGSGSRPFVDSSVDLSKINAGFQPKGWILPFEKSPTYAAKP